MSRQFHTLSEVFELERDQNLTLALEVLSLRDELPAEHPDGRLRVGNILLLANCLLCGEVQYSLRADAGIYAFTYVADLPLEDVARFLRDNKVRVPDSFNDELQALIDLAHAAGLRREVQWMTKCWGVEPSPSVKAPLVQS